MKITRKLLCITLTWLLVLGIVGNVSAASKSVLNQVQKEYETYETKATTAYESYRQKTVKSYENYRDKEQTSLNTFVNQTDKDLTNLEELLNEDLKRLEAQYSDNKAYVSQLRAYRSEVSPTSLGSAMYKYAQMVNPNSLGSLMTKYKISINENSLGSPMMHYKNAVNQYSLGSPMTKYKNAVNEYSLGSPMTKLKSNSNEDSLGSVMFKFKRGSLTQKEALKQWNASMKEEKGNIQKIINKANKDINQTFNTTNNEILAQKSKTVNGIIEQREITLKTISNLRTEYFGEGISFDSFVPDLGDINIIIGGEWLALTQPPKIVNKEVLVPLRAVYEKLNASTKIEKKGNVITLTVNKSIVKMTLNSKTANVNGKNISLKTAPKIVNGQTMIPLQLVTEPLDKQVEWNASVKTVFIK